MRARGSPTATSPTAPTSAMFVTIRWDYHYDWDGRWCNDTDSEGNTYNDTNYRSSIRAWVKYRYE